jgi:ribosomal protein S18 acetylase RimI-like enzyme
MPHSDLLLRRARLADLAALVRLEECFPSDQLSRRNFQHLLKHGNADIWVGETHDTLAGNVVLFYRRHAQVARVYSLVVHPEHQRRGMAQTLMRTAESAALARGCHTMRLEVRADNTAAITLYQRLGYVVAASIENFYEDGAKALRLSKSLTGSTDRPTRNPRPRQEPARAVSCPTA